MLLTSVGVIYIFTTLHIIIIANFFVQSNKKEQHSAAESKTDTELKITTFHALKPHETLAPVKAHVGLKHFAYIINPMLSCSRLDVFLFVFIHSSVDHFDNRIKIRQTWGSIKKFNNLTVTKVFLLGKTQNSTLQSLVVTEAWKHKDIIQGNFIDHYRNLTYKHVMGHRWITEHCSHVKNVIKIDDDVFLNIPNALKFLTKDNYFKREDTEYDAIYCSRRIHGGPMRTDGKWFVTKEEYPGNLYPTWCQGFGYIVKPRLSKRLYEISEEVGFFWIDDVYVTGMLIEKLGDVKHLEFKYPHSYKYMEKVKEGSNNVLFLIVENGQEKDRWHRFYNEYILQKN